MLLQEFEFNILHRPGVQHTVADYLSRLESGEPGTKVKDDFLDAKIFRVDTVVAIEMDEDKANLWITKMTIFLSTGLPPEGMPLDERKRLAVRSQNFCLLNNTLYHKGTDGIWRRTVRQYEKDAALHETHCDIAGDHYARETTCGGRLTQKTQSTIVDNAIYVSEPATHKKK